MKGIQDNSELFCIKITLMKKVLFITDECDLPKDYSIKSKNSEGNKASARNEMVNALNNLFDYVSYNLIAISEANKYLVNNKDTYVVTTYLWNC